MGDPWYGIEQEYTLMKTCKVGEKSTVPYGFNADGSEPAAQGPYYTGAGTGVAIGRPVADVHLAKCLEAGVKIAGINAEVMPGQSLLSPSPRMVIGTVLGATQTSLSSRCEMQVALMLSRRCVKLLARSRRST